MTEVWKDVVGYEGIYEVSNQGQVRIVKTGAIKKTKHNNRGYVQLHLFKEGKDHMTLLHRIVAEAFILNPNNYPQVNHKDENKENNAADNLEWCTNLYNRRYGTGYQRSCEKHDYKAISMSRARRVLQYLGEKKVGDYFSVKEAERQTGVNEANIRGCCYGKHKQAGGYIWRYVG